jgi:hypothetical protein
MKVIGQVYRKVSAIVLPSSSTATARFANDRYGTSECFLLNEAIKSPYTIL